METQKLLEEQCFWAFACFVFRKGEELQKRHWDEKRSLGGRTVEFTPGFRPRYSHVWTFLNKPHIHYFPREEELHGFLLPFVEGWVLQVACVSWACVGAASEHDLPGSAA